MTNSHKPKVFFFDRSNSPQDRSKRGHAIQKVLFEQTGYGGRVELSHYDRADDFIGMEGASTAASERPFDAYLLHVMAVDYPHVVTGMLLYASEHPEAKLNIGLIGPQSMVNQRIAELAIEIVDVGSNYVARALPSEENGFLNNSGVAAGAAEALRRMLNF